MEELHAPYKLLSMILFDISVCIGLVMSFIVVNKKKLHGIKIVMLFFCFLSTQMTIYTFITMVLAYLSVSHGQNVYFYQLHTLYLFLFIFDTLVYTCELAMVLKINGRDYFDRCPLLTHFVLGGMYIAIYMRLFVEVPLDFLVILLCLFLSSLYFLSMTVAYGLYETHKGPSKCVVCQKIACNESTHLSSSNIRLYNI